jgi:hypothetical protein
MTKKELEVTFMKLAHEMMQLMQGKEPTEPETSFCDPIFQDEGEELTIGE